MAGLPPRYVFVTPHVRNRRFSHNSVILRAASLSMLSPKCCPAVTHAFCEPNRTSLVVGLPLFFVEGTSHPHCILMGNFGLDVKVTGIEYVACLEAKMSNDVPHSLLL